MKLQEYREEFLFDEFPKVYNPTQKLIFTHLHDLETLKVPNKLPVIFTSDALAARLRLHFNTKDIKVFSKKSFCLLKPNKWLRLTLSDDKRVKLFVFEEDAPSRNLMVLIQKDGKVTHFYAGICMHIRNMLLLETFAACMHNGVDKLYMDLRGAYENCNPNEMDEIVDKVEDLFLKGNKVKLVIPRFGYENFVARLAFRLRARVHLNPIFRNIYGNVLNTSHFQEDAHKATIYITHGDSLEDYIISSSGTCNLITLKLVSNEPKQPAIPNFYELQYSPLPMSFELMLLAANVRPAQIVGIAHRNMDPPKVPVYLRKLCRIPIRTNIQKSNPVRQIARPLPEAGISPTKDTPAVYCIRKPNLNYMDDDNDDQKAT